MAFCEACGAALTESDAFCIKCGAPADVAASASLTPPVSAPVAPAAPSSTSAPTNRDPAAHNAAAPPLTVVPVNATPGVPLQAPLAPAPKASGTPKVAIALVAILLVLVVAGIAGVTYAVHRVRQKAAQVEAQAEIERSIAALVPNAAQNADTQGAAEDFAKGVTDSAAAAQKGNDPPPVPELRNRLIKMAGSAPDPKTWQAVEDLIRKLDDLARAMGQNANNPLARNQTKPMSQDDFNKSLAEITAGADALAQNAEQPGGAPPSNGNLSGTGGGSATASGSPSTTSPNSASAPETADPAKPASIVPVAATGDPARDWALKYERTEGGPEADLVARTGDINNLGFGWTYYDWSTKQKRTFDPFSGRSTDGHPWPWKTPADEPEGTDRIMLGSAVTPEDWHNKAGDGYSGTVMSACYWASQGRPIIQDNKPEPCNRQAANPAPVSITVGALPSKINAVLFQIFVDDFQPQAMGSHFQVSVNGTRIPSFEYAINSLDQSGPIGKLVTLQFLPEYWPLLKSGTVKLLIDDPTTHVPDGYAIDFVRILVNPHEFKYQVSLTATVTDADKHTPIAGATVNAALESAATDQQGKCELKGIPAGLVVATASAPGYDENSVPVDLPAGQNGNADIQLHRHQESTAALEQSIAQTGTATIYGIHFDTGSSKLRADSLPALNAVLGLINGRAGSNWVISGHTDNQGSDALNIPLSKARAGSVIAWLTAHGVAAGRLEPEGFGSTRPVADNATAGGRALNRRVEVALAR
jgi:OmpA-OmpF porin, OOP family